MSAGNAVWLAILFGGSSAWYWFIFRGRRYGYQTLASRTSQLLEQGVNHVWLLYSNRSVGLINAGLKHTSVWMLLNTGFIAYISGQNLVIEFPWWNKMHPLLMVPIPQLRLSNTTIIYNRKAYPAVRIVDWSYVVIGDNLQDVSAIKNLLKMASPAENGALLAAFVRSFTPDQLAMLGAATNRLPNSLAPQAMPRTSPLKAIGGAFLYVLLPCLLITAALVAWAIITRQPAFR